MNKKILVITNIPNPYRIPLFNELNRQLKERGDTLLVAFGARSYKRRKWLFNLEEEAKFAYKFLRSKLFRLGSDEKVLFTYGGLYKLLKQFKPDEVIVTGFSLAALKLWFLSFFKELKYIIWSGSIDTKGRNDSLIRKIFRKILIKRTSAFVAYGTLAKEYLIGLGAKPEKVFISFNTTDVHFYRNETEKARAKLVRNDNVKHLLYVGHLTKGKRIDLLIKLAAELKNLRDDFVVDIVGDGPERNNLSLLVKQLNLLNIVIFHGFRQRNEIPEYLAKADLFLFPSEYDIWGLVLVEAMAAGVPCIASVYAGAAYDLIVENKTGFKINFEFTAAAVDKINQLLSEPAALRKIGENACKFVFDNINLKKSAVSFIKAINKNLCS